LNKIQRFKNNNLHICYLCKQDILDIKNLTVDHIQPLSREGIDKEENYAICCSECNNEKKSMTLEEFLFYLQLKKVWSIFSLEHLKNGLIQYTNIIKTMIDIEPTNIDKRIIIIKLTCLRFLIKNFQ
jgi:hypothetical protein